MIKLDVRYHGGTRKELFSIGISVEWDILSFRRMLSIFIVVSERSGETQRRGIIPLPSWNLARTHVGYIQQLKDRRKFIYSALRILFSVTLIKLWTYIVALLSGRCTFNIYPNLINNSNKKKSWLQSIFYSYMYMCCLYVFFSNGKVFINHSSIPLHLFDYLLKYGVPNSYSKPIVLRNWKLTYRNYVLNRVLLIYCGIGQVHSCPF